MKLLFMLLITILLSAVCEGETMNDQPVHQSTYESIKDVPESAWEKLADKKIYFGHQSVGYNIVDGIKDIMKENPQIKLNIVETNDPADFNTGLFAHSRVGKNNDPKAKNDDFANLIKKGLGDKADIAFFKYCYVDANARTDVKRVFEDYENTMEQLKNEYPKTKFVHVTMPLTTVQSGAKAWVKGFLGKSIGGYDDNIQRNNYNKLLRKIYMDKEIIFELASIESTYDNKRREIFESDRMTYRALIPDYSYDGKHLNERGRKIVAENLLILLAGIVEEEGI